MRGWLPPESVWTFSTTFLAPAARSPVTTPTTIYLLRIPRIAIHKTMILNIWIMCMNLTDLKQTVGRAFNSDCSAQATWGLCTSIYDIWYDICIFTRNLVDTRWQQYITHLHTNNTHNTEKGNLGSTGRAPSLRVIPWHLSYNWGKRAEKPQLR
jgi:hypothetical protein